MAKAKNAAQPVEAAPDSVVSTAEDGSLLINMDAVAEGKFENVPKGKYNCIIEKNDYAMSKSSNQPMWNQMLSITDGDCAGRKLFNIVSFSPGAIPMAKSTIARIAPQLLSSAFNPKAIADEGTLIGTQVVATVDIEVYEGEARSRVKKLDGASNEFTG